MDEIWERAVETALDGQTDVASVRTLTLDGAVKCVHGRLPPPSLFEKFQNLQHLSLANIGLSSLDQFPHLLNLQKLILSDNRIAGGLELLVDAGLASLRDLDLSNNRIQEIDDLKPLAELKLVSLDLYECPVTRVKDYRSRVFGLIRSLRYLDKMDAEENERPESDEEEEDEDDEEDDPGSGEVDGEDGPCRMNMTNGHSAAGGEGIVDVDEEDNDWVDEIDEEDGDGDEDVVEVHEIEDSDDEEEGVEDDEEDDDDGEDDEDEDEEEVDNDEGGFGELATNGRLTSTEGEIDGHEQGEEDGEDDNGETGEEEQGVEEDAVFEDEDDAEEEEEDYGAGYLVQPVVQAEEDGGVSDVDPGHEGDDPEMEEDVEDEDGEVQVLPPAPPSSSSQKRKRDEEDDSDGDGDDDEEDDDVVEFSKSSKHP